jgi:hypothetical protein
MVGVRLLEMGIRREHERGEHGKGEAGGENENWKEKEGERGAY